MRRWRLRRRPISDNVWPSANDKTTRARWALPLRPLGLRTMWRSSSRSSAESMMMNGDLRIRLLRVQCDPPVGLEDLYRPRAMESSPDSWSLSSGERYLVGSYPGGIAFGPGVSGNSVQNLYVSDAGQGNVQVFDVVTGAFVGVFVPFGSGGLTYPDGLVFGPSGDLFVADRTLNAVLRFAGSTGAFLVPLHRSS